MEEYFSLLCPLFAGISQEDLSPMLRCLGGREKAVPKGSPVFLEGEPATHMGVVLTGTVQVVQQDYYGKSCRSCSRGIPSGRCSPAQAWTPCR